MNHEDVVQTYALEGYLLDDLTDAERNQFELHMFGCRICAEELMFLTDLIDLLRTDPAFGPRFRTPHAAAAYVLEDLSPKHKARFESHMRTCTACARNVELGQPIVKQFLEFSARPSKGTRLLSALQFVRWFRVVFGD